MLDYGMRSMRRNCLLLVAAALSTACGVEIGGPETPAVCTVPASLTAPSPAAPALFILDDSAPLTSEQQSRLADFRALPASAEVHIARLADNALDLLQVNDTLLLTMSPTRSFNAIGTNAQPNNAWWSWQGQIPGQAGTVTLVLSSADVMGTLWHRPASGSGASFSFWPLGGGLHALICNDESKYLPE